MKLSLYTTVKNGLYLDYHVVAMIKHHLPLVDEIIVNEGFSTDGTYEAICGIDPRVTIFRSEWGRSNTNDWYADAKNAARRRCTGDWCILVDCDEFIPEWEIRRLRDALESCDAMMLPLRLYHFYGNYRVHQLASLRGIPPSLGYRIHRNSDAVEVWGDGFNVRVRGEPFPQPVLEAAFDCHHFGEVRRAARLRQKWRAQARRFHGRWSWMPSLLFDLFPHRWCDAEIMPRLRLYDGPYIQAVRDDPDEFVRDNFETLRALQARGDAAAKAYVAAGDSDGPG